MKVILAIFTLALGQIGSQELTWQAPIANTFIINQYRAPASEYSSGHRGIDLAGATADLVFAPESGEINFVGKVGYRNVLTLETAVGEITFEPVCSSLQVGSWVGRGEALGNICLPDAEYVWHCEDVCLHLGLKTQNGYLSAEKFIFGMIPSRLLP